MILVDLDVVNVEDKICFAANGAKVLYARFYV